MTRATATIWLVLVLISADISYAQNYPTKPIRLVAGGVGASSDILSRLMAPSLSESLGQPLVVDNRPGNVAIPAQVVAKALPDGYTLIISGTTFWLGPLLEPLPYDPVRDFSPISLVAVAPNVLVVHPSLPVKSVKELIALAKSKPGVLNYAEGGIGGGAHLSAELFKAMANVDITHIPYKDSGAATTALLGGEVHLTFGTAPTVASHIKSARLRALAVTTAERSAQFPDLPTIAASGLPGYEIASAQAIFAPAKTPDPIISRINQEIVRYLKTEEAKTRFLRTAQEPVGSSPEQLATTVKSDIARMGKVIKDAHIGVR